MTTLSVIGDIREQRRARRRSRRADRRSEARKGGGNQTSGHAGEAIVAEMRDICPFFAEMTIDWALGGVMARPGLDLLTRQFVLIAACVTLGHAEPQLRAHVESALKVHDRCPTLSVVARRGKTTIRRKERKSFGQRN
jgi:alkylhydroperoxidase/carboxymuconolactone decarboxylase family protein YurZ